MKRKYTPSIPGLIILIILAVGIGGWELLLARTGPYVEKLPSMVRDRVSAHGGAYVPLSNIPQSLRDAIVATEDKSFRSNPGIDPAGIARSLWVDLTKRSLAQGGSTITQQLARNIYLSPEKTVDRKVKEMLLALVITHYYSKDDILEMYLNEIYLGHGAFGVERAAMIYFNVVPDTLTQAQCVLLAGLPRGPSIYDPLLNWKAARDRQREVLDSLVDARYIGAADADQVFAQPLNLAR